MWDNNCTLAGNARHKMEKVMSLNKLLTVLFLVLVLAASSISQEEKPKINKQGQLEVSPEMAEKVKRQNERLRDPKFIELKLVPVSNCKDEKSQKTLNCYTAHGKITLQLLMTNKSLEPINIATNNSYYPYNLQLFRDGQLVPYRKDVAEIVDKPPAFVSSIRVKLEPGKTEMVDMIYLSMWYRPLEPGHYQLDIKRRFQLDGVWTETASTTFEVEPE
jgi:hypothetical protein